MRVLVACEFSGVVRDAFLANGHNAWSCDLLDTETPGPHLKGDVHKFLDQPWDMMIAHPPCTYLANSGAKHMYLNQRYECGINMERYESMRLAAKFFNMIRDTDIPLICVENPIQHKHARLFIPKYQQVIQPWMFGHAETKATCLWLKGLPPLVPTKIMPKPHDPRVHHESPGPDRWKNRSRTLTGIAKAMADQWGPKPKYADED
jgi:hypothetical protein